MPPQDLKYDTEIFYDLMGLTRKAIKDQTKLDDKTLDEIERLAPEHYNAKEKKYD